jgi:hypothetical protein
MAANARAAEVTAIGRILADYNNLEVGLLHCVQMGIGDFDRAFKSMFRERGETKRINVAEKLALAAYTALGLDEDFRVGLAAIRHALKVRNQYAHWTWWDDYSGQLAIANLEDLALEPQLVKDFSNLRAHHVSAALLAEQQAFFAYVDRCLAWVNFEGRFRSKTIERPVVTKPAAIAEPALFLP